MASPKKGALGRGLNALIPGGEEQGGQTEHRTEVSAGGPPASNQILDLDPQAIEPNPKQPRKVFNEEHLEELAASIARDGVQEPVIVRYREDRYELVSGERRVRASIMAGRETIPAICRDVSDDDMLKLGLIENIQREDLNAIELAQAYQLLIAEFGWTQDELAQEVGKKRTTVTNMLRLLHLTDEVQDKVANGALTMGHARALLGLEDPKKQRAACDRVIKKGLSVRETERLVNAMLHPPAPGGGPEAAEKDPNIANVEDELRRTLGTRVALRHSGNKKGKIEIEYFDLDELERILDLFRTIR